MGFLAAHGGSRGGFGFVLVDERFRAFPHAVFFWIGNHIAFCISKYFFYIVCVLYVLKTVNFVFVIQHTQFFCLGICLNTGIENFYKNKIPKIFLKDIFRLFQTPCLSFID